MKQKLRIGSALLVAVCTLAIGIVASAGSASIEDDASIEGSASLVIDQKQFQRNIIEGEINLTEYLPQEDMFPGVYAGDTALNDFASVEMNGTTYSFWKNIENSVDDIVVVENVLPKSNTTAYVRTVFAFPAFADGTTKLHFNFYNPQYVKEIDGIAEIGGVRYKLYVYNYPGTLVPGQVSEPSLLQYVFDKDVTMEMIREFGDNYKVLITSQAVQKNEFSDLADAFGRTFQNVTATNHPWKDVK